MNVYFVARRSKDRKLNATFLADCPFLGYVFANPNLENRDIVRRHYKTCKSRGVDPVPRPCRRGKRRKACDMCVRSKQGCDFESPCLNCVLNKISCTYKRVLDDLAGSINSASRPSRIFQSCINHNQQIGLHQPQISNPELAAFSPFSISQDMAKLHGVSFPFILNYINVNTLTLADIFGYSAPPSTKAANPPQYSKSLSSLQMNLGITAGEYPQRHLIEESERRIQEMTGSADTLEARLKQLYFDIITLCASLPSEHPESAPNTNLAPAKALLTASKAQIFLNKYFEHWYPHNPIIHKGTFDTETAPLPLLLVLIIIGALYLSSPHDVLVVRGMLDLEEYSCRNPSFVALVSGTQPNGDRACNDALAAVQATLSIVQTQLWESLSSSRRRACVTRHNEIITAARALPLINITNKSFDRHTLHQRSFNWRRFAEPVNKQHRLMWAIFNVDVTLTIFHNQPPRILATELELDMLCKDEVFSAVSADESRKAVSQEATVRLPKIRTVLATFLDEGWSNEARERTENLGIRNLFIMIWVLLQIVWISKNNVLDLSDLGSITRALARWRLIWDMHVNGMASEEWDNVGFMKNAMELWYLAHMLLRVAIQGRASSRAITEEVPSLATDDVNPVRHLFAKMGLLDT
ncbi:fungal-specific transcription factor domain-containing protein [Xylogone sp. PMI_703]|nr:fungal-specific transcription factor domain-containing protein [Xylogone sp. PMI_703]